MLLMQGWLQGDTANALFERAGLDLDALRVAARRGSSHREVDAPHEQ